MFLFSVFSMYSFIVNTFLPNKALFFLLIWKIKNSFRRNRFFTIKFIRLYLLRIILPISYSHFLKFFQHLRITYHIFIKQSNLIIKKIIYFCVCLFAASMEPTTIFPSAADLNTLLQEALTAFLYVGVKNSIFRHCFPIYF